jgi:hypothetical protein
MPSIFTGYAGWVEGVKNYLDIDDVTDAQVQTFLSLAQIRLNRELASYPMEKQFSYYERPAAKVSRHLSDFDSDWFNLVGATITEVPVTMPASGRITGIYPSVYKTAWALIEDTSTGPHYFYDDKNGLYYDQLIPAGSVITVSFLAQLQSGTRNLELNIGSNGFADGAYLTLLSGGTIGSSGSFGTINLIDASVEPLGNNWYRMSIQVSGMPESTLDIGFNLTNGGSAQYAGDGVSGWRIQHHEIELQPLSNVDNYSIPSPFVITDYIPDFNKIRLVVPASNAFPMNALAINEFTGLLAAQNSNMPVGSAAIQNPWLWNTMGNYAIDAGNLYMNPIPPDNSYATLYYYVEVPPISPTLDNNIFTDNNSDALLYASCLEGSAYIVEDERLTMWQSKYADAVQNANLQSGKIKLGSTVLKRSIKGLSR